MALILVIDDNDLLRESVRETLEQAGHSVIEAENGATGFALAKQNAVDLILTDMLMPESDGVETILQIRKTYPQMKIVAMSGSREHELYLSVASRLGADAVLDKPFRAAQLRETIARLLA